MAQGQRGAVAQSRGVKRPGFWRDVAPDFATARAELDAWLYEHLGGVVSSGPFKGTMLPQQLAWKDSRLSPVLLGCYEEELHGVLRQEIERLGALATPKIAVIGCAEGYYAVGMKRLLPRATVFAVDSDEVAIALIAQTARLNEVDLAIGRELTEVFSYLDLIISDCEGAEVAYFDRERFPIDATANAIIEIHNWAHQKTDEIILNRFRGTHHINMLLEGPRNPNKFEELAGMASDYRWMAVSEGRPARMCWYHMIARGAAFA